MFTNQFKILLAAIVVFVLFLVVVLTQVGLKNDVEDLKVQVNSLSTPKVVVTPIATPSASIISPTVKVFKSNGVVTIAPTVKK